MRSIEATYRLLSMLPNSMTVIWENGCGAGRDVKDLLH